MYNIVVKAKEVIAIHVFTALFLTISLSSLVYAYYMTYEYADGITGDYVSFSFYTDETVGEFYQEFYETVNSLEEKKLFVLRYNDSINCGVYDTGGRLSNLNMVSGRNFEVADFYNGRSVAVVSVDVAGRCVEIDGTECIQVGSSYYEVIGYFQNETGNLIHPGSSVYYVLFSEGMFAEESGTIGNVCIEGNLNYDGLAENLEGEYTLTSVEYPARLKFWERLEIAATSESIIIMPLCLVLISVLLNSVNITVNWINNNKRELVVRRICGASVGKLKMLLAGRYLLLTSLAFVAGYLMAYAVSCVNNSLYIGFRFSFFTIVISWLATMGMSILSIVVMLSFGRIQSVVALRGN